MKSRSGQSTRKHGPAEAANRQAGRGRISKMKMVSRDAVELATLLASLEGPLSPQPPAGALRAQVMDLARAPRAPIDPGQYRWLEIAPGIKLHVLEEDRSRSMRACLIWARPGARHPRHRHGGDENVLVLQGTFRDDRGTYGPGDICRSRAGSDHEEEAVGEEDCICYVVYYGDLEVLGAEEPRHGSGSVAPQAPRSRASRRRGALDRK